MALIHGKNCAPKISLSPNAPLYGHSADTEVLTQRGWLLHHEVTSVDGVACFDPVSEICSYQTGSTFHTQRYNGPMRHITSKSCDALIVPKHFLLVKPNWWKSGTKSPISSGKGRPFKYNPECWTPVSAHALTNNLQVPYAVPFKDPLREVETLYGLPADAALRLLGWWIAEGCFESAAQDNYNIISIPQNLGAIEQSIQQTIDGSLIVHKRVEYTHPKYLTTHARWRIHRDDHPFFLSWLQHHAGCGGSATKRIPDEIWSLSNRQKRLLFEALIDGDGNRRKDRPGNMRYTTTSEELAHQVQRLAIELGHGANKKSNRMYQDHHLQSWDVYIGTQTRQQMFIVPKFNVKDYNFDDDIVYLKTPTGCYITRRNGKPFISQAAFLPLVVQDATEFAAPLHVA